jgi:outer membrane receptor protein involved in Fe transport
MCKAALYASAAIATIIGGDQASAAPEQPASTSPAASAPDAGDIIVTARKRQESLLNVPIVEQVVSGEDLARQQTVDLKDLTKLTPGLLVGTTVLSIGQQVSIRGVGTSSFDPGIDQSVSLNIDGLSLGQGLAYSSGMFDIAQVEVLKGPQSLFYGKSSPGGVISLRTADPTDKLELIARAGYETEAHTERGELVLSGPLSDTLKARIAGLYQHSDGFYYNNAVGIPSLGGLTPKYDRMGHSENYQIRGTLLWNPTSNFDARLKVNLVHDYAVNPENYEVTYCPDGIAGPFGVPFLSPNLVCQKGRTGYVVDLNPANFVNVPHGGVPYVKSNQKYGTLEMNYRLNDALTATSVTGVYILRSNSLFNASAAEAAGPLVGASNPDFRRDEVTEELRLNSNYSGPFNFSAGGFYQHAKVSDRVTILGNTALLPAAAVAPIQDGLNRFSVETFSLFGQLRYKILPNLELAAGARWSDETRVQTPLLYNSLTTLGLIGAGVIPASAVANGAGYAVPVTTPRLHSSKVSPEVTLTWKPSDDLTVFASYKQGNKSGSFSIATPQSYLDPNPPAHPTAYWLDNSFGDEKVEGGEIGIKGRSADRQFHFEAAAFHYVYTGLQVGSIEPTVGNTPVIRTINAGKGKVDGIEANANFRPASITGLSINTSASYTNARFTDLNGVPCYGGQTFAAGCNQQFNTASGLYFAQSLSGSPFIRAPKWQVNFGFDYDLPVGNGMKLTFSDTNHYTSKYLTSLEPLSAYYQSGFMKVDLGLTLAGRDNRWELAVIGKNVTNRYTAGNCSSSNTANGLLGGQITGSPTNAVGPAGTDEGSCFMDPGRELWIRLTLRPFG